MTDDYFTNFKRLYPGREYIGPPADQGELCECGLPAAAKCCTCNGNFCERCWKYAHSHTTTFELPRRD
jgi:hypothetical protein